MLRLETPRLTIRDVRRSDAASFCFYMQQEAYWRDLPIDPPTAASVLALVDRCLVDQEQLPRTGYLLAVTEKRSDDVIGEAILRIQSPRWRQGEIGWGISCRHTGQGLATEVGLALLHLGFDTLQLHRLYAQCRLENRASRRIMSKLAMRPEGIIRENVLARGLWWSSAQCSILSTDKRPCLGSTSRDDCGAS